jgi:hypothetical protein
VAARRGGASTQHHAPHDSRHSTDSKIQRERLENEHPPHQAHGGQSHARRYQAQIQWNVHTAPSRSMLRTLPFPSRCSTMRALMLLLLLMPCAAVEVLEHQAFLDCILDITRCTELYSPSHPRSRLSHHPRSAPLTPSLPPPLACCVPRAPTRCTTPLCDTPKPLRRLTRPSPTHPTAVSDFAGSFRTRS